MFCPHHIDHDKNRTAAQYASSTERKRLISRFLLISSPRALQNSLSVLAYTTRSGVMTRGLLSAIAAQTQMPTEVRLLAFSPAGNGINSNTRAKNCPKQNALPCGKAFLCTKILQPFAKLRTTRQAATYSSMREPFSRSKSFCTKGQQP